MLEYDKPYQYSDPVKITQWQDRYLSYPHDHTNAEGTGASHYRTFGESDKIYIPKTATQDLFESRLEYKDITRQVARPQVNFLSYPINGRRLNRHNFSKDIREPRHQYPLTTSYREGYKAPRILVQKDTCKQEPDPLLNRIPKCDFEMLPTSTHKFMDDHLVKISEGRKKINFLRQMRNSTYIFEKRKN